MVNRRSVSNVTDRTEIYTLRRGFNFLPILVPRDSLDPALLRLIISFHISFRLPLIFLLQPHDWLSENSLLAKRTRFAASDIFALIICISGDITLVY